MPDFEQCAVNAITDFVEPMGDPYWPNWGAQTPCGTTPGWGASAAEWDGQFIEIVTSFEKCIGFSIAATPREGEFMAKKTMLELRDFLVGKAKVADGRSHLKAANINLTVRLSPSKSKKSLARKVR